MNRVFVVSKVLKPALFILALLPLLWLIQGAIDDGLGANPIETITHHTGDWTLRFLLITLAVTPLRSLTRWSELIRLRRMLGLYAFFYATLHFVTWAWLDQALNWPDMLEDILTRPFITLGFFCLVLLLPLAATSNRSMLQRLGGRRWKQLHQLAYVSTLGGCLHYLWLVKADTRDPLIYLLIFCALMLFRLPALTTRVFTPGASRQ